MFTARYELDISAQLRIILFVKGDCKNWFLGECAELRKSTFSFHYFFLPSAYTSVCLSVCNDSSRAREIFIKFYIWVFFENLSGKCKFDCNLKKNGTLCEGIRKFVLISFWIFVIMRNILNKFVEKIKTRILSRTNFFPPKISRLWNNVEKYSRERQASEESLIRSKKHAICMRDN
jgi:hypothetical protein